ncbi:hypothetical protein DSM106972_058650 [Dulcicalothrix desertica PCC 7102]|uniref:Uncharacterized protein n=1 Tax=Dulcicalothrix desertica PCC 7102 TaxID=232991 RepID=A0A3S1CIT6_9CYAN|nr:hypothetical protein [Dulcicalothrix desertica]RUT02387.1 hypothetical protein DSM106972_058650 [Dulcicalothrix desertica PCC 7102]TWH55393.1 hypothetical protein CAL7102_03522 [Dulcicalothrix desertica PCC 7102]
MEANNTIEIHEFSTGIRAEETADGGWVSQGFTGQYMNMTLDKLPSAVENSIHEKEFEVTEGASSDKPAIIGRVVGSDEDTWSVVAVVTRGQDNVSRSFSVYRYFLCKGENIEKILAWLDSRGIPTFNPFDSKFTRQPYPCPEDCPEYTPESSKVPNINFKDSEPTLLEPEKCNDFKILNFLAAKKSEENKQPVSWAYNVEALEKPRKFQLIQPASQRAHNILDRAIKNIAHSLAPVIMDEEAIKSAIRGLINSSQVKPEAVEKIAEAIQNEQITEKYWHSLFDAQGAKIAISQKIYSPQMVRLITLRAMVIPETLPEFMDWLNFKGNKSKLDDNQTISLDFQKAIQGKFPTDGLTKGIKLLLLELLNNKITPESIYLLLMIKGSAWHSCCKEFTNDVFDDLQLIAKHVKPISVDFKCQAETWNSLTYNWSSIKSNYFSCSQYKPLAQLFEQLKDYRLSAYFYQVSTGEVPKYIFKKISKAHQRKIEEELGLELYCKLALTEKIYNYAANQEVPIQYLIFLLALFVLFTASKVFSEPKTRVELADLSTEKNQSVPSPTTHKTKLCNTKNLPTLTKDEINNANNKFNETRESIEKIVDNFQKNSLYNNLNEEEIAKKILHALGCKNLNTDTEDFKAIIQNKSLKVSAAQQSELVKVIYQFQDKNKQKVDKADGIIYMDGKTYKELEKQAQL